MNSMHLSDDEQVHVHGAPSYSVRAEVIDDHGQRHAGFLAASPSELARLDINRPETWPAGTRAVAEGSLYKLTMPGPVRLWQRVGPDPNNRRPSAQHGAPRGGARDPRHPQGATRDHQHPARGQQQQQQQQHPTQGQRHPHDPARRNQRWVPGRWQRGAHGKMVWVEGHYELDPGGARAPSPHGHRAPGRPAPPPPRATRPGPPPSRPLPPDATQPGPQPAPPYPPPAPPPPEAVRTPWTPAYPVAPSPHRDFDRSYSVSVDPTWGAHVYAVYEDGSIALHDGRTYEPEDIEHYYGNGVIVLRDGEHLSPPEGAHPVHAGHATTWASPVGVPGPQSAVHNGVTFVGLPPGTMFFDEDHSFGYQTAQGEVVTGFWSPDGTYEVDDPTIEEVRKAAAEGAAEGVANAFEAMSGFGFEDEDEGLLSLLER
jgi:hypothetical protein